MSITCFQLRLFPVDAVLVDDAASNAHAGRADDDGVQVRFDTINDYNIAD
ncbi:hypothetical protein LOZ80_19650 [Paenibacillus sp. HWE-109]|nr:hypothetical protein [Paenibacillus sp. HWE-109]UKS23861.1 hypothetical protein LOZ80_19650 [Paenibacillus sp. HWE-109]